MDQAATVVGTQLPSWLVRSLTAHRFHYPDSMRDAAPLPGKTPAEVLSQLAHRTFGPLRIDRVRAVLDYHGLADHEAEPQTAVAARHAISDATLRAWRLRLAAAGSRQPLSVDLVTEISRRSRLADDHLSRARIASTFGFQPPAGPRRPPPPSDMVPARPPSSPGSAARIACRVLAAVGPQTLPTLVHSVLRSRRFRDRQLIDGDDLAAALVEVGAVVDEQGRWHAPPGWPASERDSRVVSTATARELTRREMSAVLIAAGYSPLSASGRTVDTHPLIRKVAIDRYRLVADQAPGGPSRVATPVSSPVKV